MRSERRFETLAGPMSAEEFESGDYPIEKLTRGLREFTAVLQTASNIQVIKKEFERIFGGKT